MTIFSPFRALGYITDTTPLSIQRRGRETFVTTSVGKAWQIFNCDKLSLVFVGPPLQQRIRALTSWRDFTFAAHGCHIGVFHRARKVALLSHHTDKVILLLTLGDHIISVGRDRQLVVWDAKIDAADAGEVMPAGSVSLPADFTPTCIVHPDTYLNKVLLGSQEGHLQLWNVSSKKLIHDFKGWGSPIHCMASSPALDTVAVGCANGQIHIHNLKYDETLMSFSHTTTGPVTALAFRTDGKPFLAAGGSSGSVSVWDLEKRKLQSVMKDAHNDKAVVSLHFFPREPVLLSSGADNALRMWVFDSGDNEARLLRFRSGHSAPPSIAQYYGDGRHILSAGYDRAFRLFSTVQDQQSREISQGHVGKRAKKLKLREEDLKLSPVVGMAAAEVASRDWCNVVTCHEGDSAAYTWRLHDFVIGEHVLTPPGGTPTPVTSCAVSGCGNFAFVGTAGGRVERFNLQSGLHRGSFQEGRAQYSGAHAGPVEGIACDATNTAVVTGGYDGALKLWRFKSGTLVGAVQTGSPIVKMAYHRGNGLLLCASEDHVLRVYDCASTAAGGPRLVRQLAGHSDRVTSVCQSSDGRWALSASLDGTVRTWDVVTGRQLDAMRCGDVAPTCVSLSPGMDTLATTHVNRNAIFLWANKAMYTGLEEAASLGSGAHVRTVSMPDVHTGLGGSGGGEGEEEADAEEEEEDEEGAGASAAPADVEASISGAGVPRQHGQLLPELITLALLPRSQWQNLVKLDVIKERNKPMEPPKKPEQAPFFLPTLPTMSGDTVFAPAEGGDRGAANGGAPGGNSRVKRGKEEVDRFRSPFSRLLHAGSASGDYSELGSLLRNMSPSAIDMELQSMEILEDVLDAQEENVKDIELLLDFLYTETLGNRGFELVQALMHRSLTIHGDFISKHTGLQTKAKALLEAQKVAWKRLDGLFQSVRCMAGFLSNTQ